MYIPRGILCLHLSCWCVKQGAKGCAACIHLSTEMLGDARGSCCVTLELWGSWGNKRCLWDPLGGGGRDTWEKLLAWQHLGKHYQTSLSCEMASPGAEGEAGWLQGGSDVVFWVYFATLRGDGSVTPQELTR